jgi:uncharacterized protein YbaA (DUF1428 family)
VAAVPSANRERFRKHASEAAAVFRENGALGVVECWGDDVPEGQVTSFPMAVKRKNTVGRILVDQWPQGSATLSKIMADPRMQPDKNPMPFDGQRVIFGGFEVIVEE